MKYEINDDPFFQPKDIGKRDYEQKRKVEEKRKEIVSKIKNGLQNVRNNYENENWDSLEEKLFLEIFFTLHLNKRYDEWADMYQVSLSEYENRRCSFRLKNSVFCVSNKIESFFKEKFHWSHGEVYSFMKSMLKKNFELNKVSVWFVEY